MQAERQPQFPLLYSLQGFRYCDLILAPAERAAWAAVISKSQNTNPKQIQNLKSKIPDLTSALAACTEAARRAEINIREHSNLSLLSIALDHLTLARAELYRAILEQSNLKSQISNAATPPLTCTRPSPASAKPTSCFTFPKPC